MHIKQIIIQGFKSYKDQTVIEPFSPKHNVIVGRNGSGKSNFFAAIRFVLSDAYTQMGREERQALLHEGSGQAVMSAYVEIIFDNSDERFLTGKEEVVIRRTIGLKKDEYSLDRKSATKTDVMNLLESAGFSRSNPYYIVPQGRVTTLTNMKDPERLTLLKEIAGTQVYEQRRAESLKIMDETSMKRDKIDELLKYIEERLDELEEEKEELRGYQENDREKRCLEYTILHREQLEINSAVDQIEEGRARGAENNDDALEKFREREKEIEQLIKQLSKVKQEISLRKTEKKQLDQERREHLKSNAQLDLAVREYTDNQASRDQSRQKHKQEMNRLQSEIASHQKELEKLLPEYNARKADEAKVRNELDQARAIQNRLHAKQGRNANFSSKKERDTYLKGDIAQINANLTRRQTARENLEKAITSVEEKIQALEAELQQTRSMRDNRAAAVNELQDKLRGAETNWDKLNDQRKTLLREDNRVSTTLGALWDDLKRAESSLSHMMDRDTSRGLQSMRAIRAERNMTGVYGTIADLCQVEDVYRTAVEVTAGNSLFHVVVDNDRTASELVEAIAQRGPGRITIMPLNRIRNRPVSYPDAVDAIPMLEKMSYDKKYHKAFDHVFGKTIICPDLHIASQYARSHGLSAIDLEGKSSDKRGALSGGYYDTQRSRLNAVRQVNDCQEAYENAFQQSREVKDQIKKLDQEINQAQGNVNQAEFQLNRLEKQFHGIPELLQQKTSQLSRLRDDLRKMELDRDNSDVELARLNEQLAAHKTELASEFKKNLSSDEEQSLSQALDTIQKLGKALADVSTKRADVEQMKTNLESMLHENLEVRLDQLKATSEEGESESTGGIAQGRRITDLQADLKRIKKATSSVEQKLQEIEDSIEKYSAEIVKLEKAIASRQSEQEQEATNIEKYQKRIEKSMAKRSMLVENAAEVQRKIRDLGVLPDEAFEKYTKFKSDTLVNKLKKVHENLKKFSHVNKKAFEQYNNFTKQRDTLRKRREELDESQGSIEDLIQVLDQRKDEAIERTFRQVSKNFAEIFEKLVPLGRGRLVIQRKADSRNRREEEDSDDEGGRSSVENYLGVGISVSFNSKHDEQQKIQQLSGGQKSLCALALVFAIQQCDPAPFYLFDEIDANLDAQYRTAVAQMVKNLSTQGGQFICTTFRREMVLTADQHYGVTFLNKMSSIDLVSKDEALAFVDGQKQ
ncbi:chromosome segregation protein sudA [Drechslerella stenobrocha 248]|uniref:Structural maintenance of chromosomes protein n=1 Tax=Drechslerella stenobrocha 248 TaxID=1043628 RepID=W7I3L7_9PEZI|nr:chromosome segregation protein sudA [Drechslerella stenobrocha 248]